MTSRLIIVLHLIANKLKASHTNPICTCVTAKEIIYDSKLVLVFGLLVKPGLALTGITQPLHTYQINLSSFTKDFRVWGGSSLRLLYFSAGSHKHCFLKIMQDGSTSSCIYQACAMVTRRLPREPSRTRIFSSETINTGGTVGGFSLSYQF